MARRPWPNAWSSSAMTVTRSRNCSSLWDVCCSARRPESNSRRANSSPRPPMSFAALRISSGEQSSVPRARFTRQYTSGSVSTEPSRSTSGPSTSAISRASSAWKAPPASSRVTGLDTPRLCTMALSFSWSAPAAAPFSCEKRSMTCTTSLALAMRLSRSEKAALTTRFSAFLSRSCCLIIPLMPAEVVLKASSADGFVKLASATFGFHASRSSKTVTFSKNASRPRWWNRSFTSGSSPPLSWFRR
mmetsp:Transcript_41581/g.130234  ORF Transcript_41581/g.130234 Transcript_41581/m.130234 type:complete len:246 (-) Transcript_41581:429-1166(-)